ncbi:gamma carbonic anhydrase family protein [Billgrantia endophytica]|uniref:Phenylacetic acid degradation protein PaaY n=1 Tax=Billgrantia endophytica TaxID=2033802 RepID=A0A2N7TZZ7_9GAMM|nr:phenylacetic acid degradation protein PaaY [Halomonas endophytica]PMR73733.1 phenylacetic acid degradation protein PaaY [Halomonas endophytica]
MAVYLFEGVKPTISPSAFVHPMAVLIGDVSVGDGCYVGPGACLRGDFGRIVMEPESNLQDNCVVHGTVGSSTVIRRRGHIGHGAVIHGCVVGEEVLVGMNAVVMDDSMIAERSIIGSCALVKAGFVCEPASLLLGAPARVVKILSDGEIMKQREATQRYIELAKRCLSGLRAC